MKKKHKILIAIFAVVFVAVIVLIFTLKSDKPHESADENNSTSYTQPDSAEEDVEEHEDVVQSTDSHEQTEDKTDSDKGNVGKVPAKPASPKHESSVQNNKTYDLTNSEVLETQKSSFGDIRLLTATDNGIKVYLLEATVNNKKFYYEMPSSYIVENIYFANVDGEYGDEIIVRSQTLTNGIYDNAVLKITSSGIKSLFEKKEALDIMSTYRSDLKANFNVEIVNQATGLKKTVNVLNINDENYADSYWDENGKLMETDTVDRVWFETSYFSFQPADVDDDGFSEIICLQYATLGNPDSVIGIANTTLKFDAEAKKFKIFETNFTIK